MPLDSYTFVVGMTLADLNFGYSQRENTYTFT